MIISGLLALIGGAISVAVSVAPIALTAVAIAAGAAIMFELLNRDSLEESKKRLLSAFNESKEFKDRLGKMVREAKTVYTIDKVTGKVTKMSKLSDGSVVADIILSAGNKTRAYAVAANQIAPDVKVGMSF